MGDLKEINNLNIDTGVKEFNSLAIGSVKNINSKTPCLVKGTLVTMADGTEIPIEKIKPRDRIRTYKVMNKEISSGRVTWVQKPRWVTSYLSIKAEDGTELKITEEHPIFIMTNNKFGKFINAGKVKEGQKFLNKENKLVEIIKIKNIKKKAEVYNFVVSKYHNYFGAGLLCHNTQS